MASTKKTFAVPSSVRLLGNEWSIEGEKPGRLGCRASGLADHKWLRIVYEDDWAPQKIIETVWHEVIHEIDEQCYLSLKEKQVHVLAAITLAVIRDNPEFAKWLMEGG